MTVYIQFNQGITPETVNALTDVISQIANQDEQKFDLDGFYILLNSSGGHVDSGIALYNFLSGLSYPVTIHNVGSVDSVATVIFLAGDSRYAAPGSSFLFHGVSSQFQSGTRLSVSDFREHLSSLERDENKVKKLVSGNCDVTEDELNELHQQGEAKALEWAMEKSIINEVVSVDIPSDAHLITIN